MKAKMPVLFFLVLLITGFSSTRKKTDNDEPYISYRVNPAKATLKLFWKDDKGRTLKSIAALKNYCNSYNENLVFAMNGGMYKEDNSPLGLFICRGRTLAPLNKRNGAGNFYLKPNGILYIKDGKTAGISSTENFIFKNNIEYATQSGPMLVMDGNILTSFKKGSANLNIRNGVGILPGNILLFAMSKKEVSLYDFADYFKKAGCINALYLDGFVSRTYLPQKNWIQTDGNFGVMIAVVKK